MPQFTFSTRRSIHTRTLKFGASFPKDPDQKRALFDAIQTANDLYNDYVAIHNEAQEKRDGLFAEFNPEVPRLLEDYGNALRDVEAREEEDLGQKGEVPEGETRKVGLKSQEEFLKKKLRECSEGEKTHLKERLQAVQTHRKEVRAALKEAKANFKETKEILNKASNAYRTEIKQAKITYDLRFEAEVLKHYRQREALGHSVEWETKVKKNPETGKIVRTEVPVSGPSVRAEIRDRIQEELLNDPKMSSAWKAAILVDREESSRKKKCLDKKKEEGLRWETANLIDEQVSQAIKMAKKDAQTNGDSKKKRSPSSPKLKFKRGLEMSLGRVGGQVLLSKGDSPTITRMFAPTDQFFEVYNGMIPLFSPYPKDTWDERGRRIPKAKGVRGQGKRQVRLVLLKLVVWSPKGEGSKTHQIITVPVYLHRPLPSDSLIKTLWIQVVSRRGRKECELCVQVESKGNEYHLHHKPGKGVAVFYPTPFSLAKTKNNKKGATVQIGVLVTGPKQSRPLELPEEIWKKLLIVNLRPGEHEDTSMKSASDKYFNQAKAEYLKALENKDTRQAIRKALLPVIQEEIRAKKAKGHFVEDKTPAQVATDLVNPKVCQGWKKHNHLLRVARLLKSSDLHHRLWTTWKKDRLKGKPLGNIYRGVPKRTKDLFTPQDTKKSAFELITTWAQTQGVQSEAELLGVYLDFWSHKEYHLQEVLRNVREKTLAQRKDLYANWARDLSKEFDVLIMPDMNLAQMAKAPDEDDKGDDISRKMQKNMSSLRRGACLSSFKEAVYNAFGDRCLNTEYTFDQRDKTAADEEKWSSLTPEQKGDCVLQEYRAWKRGQSD